MARIPAAVISGVFAAIGLTVIVFLWSQPFGAFHSPPLFFRIFGSLIAIVFVVVGGSGVVVAFSKDFGARPSGVGTTPPGDAERVPPAGSYVCPNCGATLAGQVDVSPSGDAKCPYCKSWLNIHRRPA